MSVRNWTEEDFGSGPPCGHVYREGDQILGSVVPAGDGSEWLTSIRNHVSGEPMWVRSHFFETETRARAYVERETAEGRAA